VAVTVSQVAFGRDNLGINTDRVLGSYALQFTTTPNPDATTPNANWTTVGTIVYPGTIPSPALRHRYSFTPVQATGFRIKVQTSSFPIGIDELELYDYDPVPDIAVEQPPGTPLDAMIANLDFGSENLNTPGAAETFTVRSTGTGALSIASVTTVGGDAADFMVNTTGMVTTVSPGSSTTFTVSFSPAALDNRSTTLRVASNDPDTPNFDVQLSGTGIDILPPVIATPANITVFSTGPLTTVTYAPTATDNSGSTPSLTVTPPSGSPFNVGVTTVNVTATDGSGNQSFASFTVTVLEPPHLEVQEPVGTALAGSPPTVDFGPHALGVSATKVFTLKNTGLSALTIGSVSTVGGHAGDFTVDTAGMATSVAPNATTTVAVTFLPTAPGARSSTLRIASNDPDRTDYDITVSGTGLDTVPPVIRRHLDRTAVATNGAGAVVNYGPALVTDNSGLAPTVTYSPVSGSLFPPGATTVAITATDAAGNIATSSFTVIVLLRPRLAVEEPAGTALLGTGVPVAWGQNNLGATTVPAGLTGITSVDVGTFSHTLALRSDGTVTGWGDNGLGQISGAAGLSGIVSIQAGLQHGVALKDDGTVAVWGDDSYGQLAVPGGLAHVVAIATGSLHNLALKDDGTVVVWGDNGSGQLNVPPDLSGVVAITAGKNRCVALKLDGTVVQWGESFGSLPPSGLSGVLSLAAGQGQALALKSDGTVVGWGSEFQNEISGFAGMTGIRAVSAGFFYSLALKSNGTILALGDDEFGRVSGAAPWQNVVAISAGERHAAAVVRVAPVVAFGTQTVGGSTTKTITLRNSGLSALQLGSVGVTGGNAAEFTVNTAGLPSDLPPDSSATFTVTFTPTTTAPSTTTLRVASNDPDSPAFDVALNGNTADAVAPVIAAHAQVSAVRTSAAGAVVTYAPASATDNSGAAPVITYSHASGSVFPPGNTTVTITATDANGNAATETFTVTVTLPPPVLVETGGTFAANNLATGGTAFAKNVIAAAPHAIAKVNDGTYGNVNSWIAGSLDSFIGISLGSTPVSLNRIAFGRDNLGNFGDRVAGSYTVQFTTVPNPNAATPDADWTSLGTITYPGSIPSPAVRHLYAFSTVSATGVRIRTQAPGDTICIDEIELYSVPSVVAPVAGVDTLVRLDSTRTAKVLQSVLLANDTDADNDPLTINAVANPLPSGATVQLAGNFVLYTAPAANSGAGSFTYTVDDGAGHTTTGTVTVIQVPTPTAGDSPPGAISATLSGADVVVTFIGVPGRGYRVQYTTSLGAPYTWQEFSPAAVVTAPAGGVFSHTDLAPGGGARFYRAIPNP
jgi:alpha-tubulin suppressor-like RCC1 family protein